MTKRKDVIAAIAATIAVVATLAIGYKMLGPHQREISADIRRVDDLRALSGRIYRANGNPLPTSLSEFGNNANNYPRDPLTHAPYEYLRGSGTNYQLCATFAFASKDEDDSGFQPTFYWDHPKGHYCFQLDAAKWN